MADYTAVLLPGLTFTSQASDTISGGDPLEVSGSGTVARCAGAASAKFAGVAAHDAISGAKVTVIAARPVFDGTADGAITAGDQLVASNVAGRQVKTLDAAATDFAEVYDDADAEAAVNAAVNGARAVIGLALTSAGDNATVRWQLR